METRRLEISIRWLLASSIGAGVACGVCGLLFLRPDAARGDILIHHWLIWLSGPAIGALLGFAQWVVIRPHLPSRHRWLVSSIMAGAVGVPLFAYGWVLTTVLAF